MLISVPDLDLYTKDEIILSYLVHNVHSLNNPSENGIPAI